MAKVIDAATARTQQKTDDYETWECWVWQVDVWEYVKACDTEAEAQKRANTYANPTVIIHIHIPPQEY